MKTILTAKLQSMAKNELLDLIPKDTLDRIKVTDKRPEFRAYTVGHEGEANPVELGMGKKTFRWMKNVVVGLANKLGFGTPVFDSHGAGTNSHEGRVAIGEVVGKAVREIGNKVSAIAALYIYPEHRRKTLDVASVEAEIEYSQDDQKNKVLDVLGVSGIALGNSAMVTPGFAGATLLSCVQAFSKGGTETMTLAELKEAVRELKCKVTDLFDKSEILESSVVAEAVDTHKGHAKRVEKQLGEERERIVDLTKKLDETNGKVKGLNEKLSSQTGRTMFETAVTTRKLDEKEKAFIARNLNNFKSDKADAELQGDFDRWLDAQVKDYQETAKLLGIEPKKEGAPDPNAGGNAGGATDGAAAGATEAKYVDPKTNDLIPA